MLMPGLPAQPVIHVAIGRRQVTMTEGFLLNRRKGFGLDC
jgi:hypothetical protein